LLHVIITVFSHKVRFDDKKFTMALERNIDLLLTELIRTMERDWSHHHPTP